MRTNVDETETMGAFNCGCHLAFKKIFDAKFGEICRYIAFKIRDRQQAEDFAAEIFVELWKRHGNFSSLEKIQAFLYKSAKNHVRNYYKKQQTSIVRSIDAADLSNIVDDFNEYDKITMELLTLVHNNMHCLSSQKARIVSMVVMGMDDMAISRKMGISAKTVRNQRMRAVHYLKNILPAKLNGQ